MKLLCLLRSVSLTILTLLFSFTVFAQVFPVSGKITSADGQPLAGVTIQVKGTDTKTASNSDGSFQIIAPSANSVLVLSYVGFAPMLLS